MIWRNVDDKSPLFPLESPVFVLHKFEARTVFIGYLGGAFGYLM